MKRKYVVIPGKDRLGRDDKTLMEITDEYGFASVQSISGNDLNHIYLKTTKKGIKFLRDLLKKGEITIQILEVIGEGDDRKATVILTYTKCRLFDATDGRGPSYEGIDAERITMTFEEAIKE